MSKNISKVKFSHKQPLYSRAFNKGQKTNQVMPQWTDKGFDHQNAINETSQ